MASGHPILQIQEITSPDADFAVIRSISSASTPAETVRVWEFGDSGATYLDLVCTLEGYSGGGLTIFLSFGQQTAGAGDVRWEVAFRRIQYATDDFDSGHTYVFGSGATVAVSGTAGIFQLATITVDDADMDGVADRDLFIIRLRRDPAHVDDDLATAAHLMTFWAIET